MTDACPQPITFDAFDVSNIEPLSSSSATLELRLAKFTVPSRGL